MLYFIVLLLFSKKVFFYGTMFVVYVDIISLLIFVL